MKNICVEIPIKTISEANCSEHWKKKHKRHKNQKFLVKLALKRHICQVILPCQVNITRLSPGTLDFDNLVSSQKWVVDAVCDCLIPGLLPGRADGDRRIKISYDQQRSRLYGIKINIQY